MQYNWEKLLAFDSLEGGCPTNIKLELDRDSYCDENVERHHIVKFNNIARFQDLSSYNLDKDRMEELKAEVVKSIFDIDDGFVFSDPSIFDTDDGFEFSNPSDFKLVMKRLPDDGPIEYQIEISSYKNDKYQLDYLYIKSGQECYGDNWKNEDPFFETNRTYICFYEIENKDNFWVVSCDSHPLIEATDFSYGNSDGSGPDMDYDPNNFDEIFNGMIENFNEFASNNYH
jgi:hypothetical protein